MVVCIVVQFVSVGALEGSADVVVTPVCCCECCHHACELVPGQGALLGQSVDDLGHVQLCAAHGEPRHQLLTLQGARLVRVEQVERLKHVITYNECHWSVLDFEF